MASTLNIAGSMIGPTKLQQWRFLTVATYILAFIYPNNDHVVAK